MIIKDFHFKISIAKSLLRVVGFIEFLVSPLGAVIFLVSAEILGIVEELGGTKET